MDTVPAQIELHFCLSKMQSLTLKALFVVGLIILLTALGMVFLAPRKGLEFDIS